MKPTKMYYKGNTFYNEAVRPRSIPMVILDPSLHRSVFSDYLQQAPIESYIA
ncbi:hypothetical protein PPBDW_u10031 [Photobacterium kishitanii]|nr:hypothetical protein PPBDW_u10031 [Photobacterium kishitanii]